MKVLNNLIGMKHKRDSRRKMPKRSDKKSKSVFVKKELVTENKKNSGELRE